MFLQALVPGKERLFVRSIITSYLRLLKVEDTLDVSWSSMISVDWEGIKPKLAG